MIEFIVTVYVVTFVAGLALQAAGVQLVYLIRETITNHLNIRGHLRHMICNRRCIGYQVKCPYMRM